MFVRGGITAMMQDGAKVKKRCLFMMDEFYTLGKLDIVAKSAGLMRGYGLHLWPFLQDLGQLQTLYGEKLSETFFGNADAHIFFGNTDSITLNYVSNQLGEFETGEVNAPPPKQAFTPSFWSNHLSLDGELTRDGKLAKDEWDAAQETHNRQHQYAMSRVGKSRVPADKVRSIVAKKNGDAVAQSMIVIAKGSDILNLRLDPYFLERAGPATIRSLKEAHGDELWRQYLLKIDQILDVAYALPLIAGGYGGLSTYNRLMENTVHFSNPIVKSAIWGFIYLGIGYAVVWVVGKIFKKILWEGIKRN
jgi:hypothetical protein